jgi:urease accessory protein UreF
MSGKCFLRAAKEAFSSTSVGMSQLSGALDFKHEYDRLNRNKVDVKMTTKQLHLHYAPIFGCVCGILQVNEELSCRMFLRCMLRDIFSCAARLNILGPLEGAKKQKEFTTVIEKLLKKYHKKDDYKSTRKRKHDSFDGDINENDDSKNEYSYIKVNNEKIDVQTGDSSNNMGKYSEFELEPYVTSPILEIIQARHDVLYARLFNS